MPRGTTAASCDSTPSQAPLALGSPRPRHGRLPACRGEPRRGPDRDPAPAAAARAGDRRRAPRPDELGQDPRRARVPRRAGARRLRRPAADARAGGASPARRRLGHGSGRAVTGEERINEHAPILCCTVEMAPDRGEVLVLDEVQWADDEERGRRLDASSCSRGSTDHVRLLGALDALPLVRRAFPDAELRVHERKLPLEFVGARQLRGAHAGHRSRRLQPQGGARARGRGQPAASPTASPCSTARCRSPRGARRSTASSPAPRTSASRPTSSGTASTFPCETLLFAETTKFDGESRRDLLPWELAQIAGRAGRFGLVERGHVGVLVGVAVGERRSRARRVGARAARRAPRGTPRLPHRRRGADRAAARRPRHRRPARPRRRARGLASRRGAPVGARELARGRVAAADPRPPRRRRASSAERGRRLGLEDTWKLVNAPIDPDGAELLGVLALAVAGDRAQRPLLQFLLDTSGCATPRSRRRRRRAASPRSCAGSRCSTPASAA